MAINFAEKYEKQLATVNILESVIAGRINTDYSFDGTKAINILTPVTQPLVAYTRSGSNRYGSPAELQDTKQRIELTKDMAFSMTIDKGNNSDQMHAKETGKVVKAQIGEQVTPYFDKLGIAAWAAGSAANKLVVATPDKDNVLDMFIAARKAFVNAKFAVNPKECTAYVTASVYALLLKNPQFISVESLGKDLLSKGVVGTCQNFLIKEVPDDYLPGTHHAVFTHKKAVICVNKLNELNIHDNPPGINGTLIEGRYYGDAAVLDVFKGGVFNITKA